jgi:hypothetical protein
MLPLFALRFLESTVEQLADHRAPGDDLLFNPDLIRTATNPEVTFLAPGFAVCVLACPVISRRAVGMICAPANDLDGVTATV